MAGRHRIFISWSGQRSEIVAEALREQLPCIIQSLDPWTSSKDISKGSVWLEKLHESLEQSRLGVVCVTPENVDRPWVNFEAGALWRSAPSDGLVATYAIGFDGKALPYPLAQFQDTRANREQTWELVKSINDTLGEDQLSERVLAAGFDAAWPRIEEAIREAESIKVGEPETKLPAPEETLNDVLSALRRIEKSLAVQSASNPWLGISSHGRPLKDLRLSDVKRFYEARKQSDEETLMDFLELVQNDPQGNPDPKE